MLDFFEPSQSNKSVSCVCSIVDIKEQSLLGIFLVFAMGLYTLMTLNDYNDRECIDNVSVVCSWGYRFNGKG